MFSNISPTSSDSICGHYIVFYALFLLPPASTPAASFPISVRQVVCACVCVCIDSRVTWHVPKREWIGFLAAIPSPPLLPPKPSVEMGPQGREDWYLFPWLGVCLGSLLAGLPWPCLTPGNENRSWDFSYVWRDAHHFSYQIEENLYFK